MLEYVLLKQSRFDYIEQIFYYQKDGNMKKYRFFNGIGGGKNQIRSLSFLESIQLIHPHTNSKIQTFKITYFSTKIPILITLIPYRTPYRKNPYFSTILTTSHPNFQNSTTLKTIQPITLSFLYISIFTDNQFSRKLSKNRDINSKTTSNSEILKISYLISRTYY